VSPADIIIEGAITIVVVVVAAVIVYTAIVGTVLEAIDGIRSTLQMKRAHRRMEEEYEKGRIDRTRARIAMLENELNINRRNT